jgi:hypothetical protein
VLGHARCRAGLDRWWQVQEADDVSALIRLVVVKPAEYAVFSTAHRVD